MFNMYMQLLCFLTNFYSGLGISCATSEFCTSMSVCRACVTVVCINL